MMQLYTAMWRSNKAFHSCLQVVLHRKGLTHCRERYRNRKFFLSCPRMHVITTFLHNPHFILKAVKNRSEVQAGKAQQCCYTRGDVEPLHFYEQTCELSQLLKAAEVQPCLTSLWCRPPPPSGFMKLYTLFRGPGRIWALPPTLLIVLWLFVLTQERAKFWGLFEGTVWIKSSCSHCSDVSLHLCFS